MAVPEYSPRAQVFESINGNQERIVIGYAYIPETPYILMMIKPESELIQPWYKTTWAFAVILATSIIMILLVALGVATHLVNQIHDADQERVDTLHQVEYANKMVSLGRLASGVAHEIGGTISVQSRLGKGTRFNIRIPLDVDENNPEDSSPKRKTEL